MCFSETWLTPTINDIHVDIDGFTIVRSDRTTKSGKQTGGVCAYINDKWAHNNNIHIKKTLCTPDIELLAVSIRPYYLPREISHVIINVVYIPPEANTTVSKEIISDWLHELETSHPDSLRLVLGDFNKCTLLSSCSTYKQYVSCPTRNASTLDLCYGNIANA